MTLKKIVPAVCAALLAACGSSGNAALSKTFNYAPPQPASTSEQAAGSSAQATVADTAAFSGAPDAARGVEIAGLALSLASEALGDATFGMAPSGAVHRALTRAATFDTCATVAAGTVTFKDCVDGEAGFEVKLNGSITATAGNVSWGLTATFAGTGTDGSLNITMHHTGDITVSSSKISGNAASDFGGSVSAQGQNVSFGFAVATLLDLSYQTAPTSCITSGSVEVRRVWTQKPNGASGAGFNDAGIKLLWSACDSLQVAHSQ